MNIEKVYVVNDENYSKDSIRKCAYINVASGKPSFQNCVIMKAYASFIVTIHKKNRPKVVCNYPIEDGKLYFIEEV